MNGREVAVGGCESNAGWSLSGENAGAGGRAERAGRVGAGEGHATFGETFDVRSFVELAPSVESRVSPAQIVGDDKNDILAIRREDRSGDGAKD